MKLCSMLRKDTGVRCTNLVRDEDDACDDCCEALEELLECRYLEELYAGTLPGLKGSDA